jgi:hypothetical protein
MAGNYGKLTGRDDVIFQSYYILEPPVVDQQSYNDLGNLTKYFHKVYIHNAEGAGYEKRFRNQPNIYKLRSPQIRNGIIESIWNQKDREFLVLINANKMKSPLVQLSRKRGSFGFKVTINSDPGTKNIELYSERIRAAVELKKLGDIDLYGYGWDLSLSQISGNIPAAPFSFPWLYLRHRKTLNSSYKGTVKSKHETLGKYKFCICFENAIMPGWITEKIFDCLYVGTVPVYLGAPDIEENVPKECFIDMRNFKDYAGLYNYLKSLSDKDIDSFREAGREFLSSEKFRLFSKERFVDQLEKDLFEVLKAHDINLVGLKGEDKIAG